MGKAPAFQFYVKDWLGDPQLQMASSSSRGIWINALCFMWEAPERGKIVGEKLSMARMLLANNGDFDHFLEEAQLLQFCDVSVTETSRVTECSKIVTLINRRMFRDGKEKENHRLRQERYRQKSKCDAKVTGLSSSSSSSSKKENIKRKKITDEEWLQEIRNNPAFEGVDIDKQLSLMDAWLSTKPGKQKTRRFIVNWLSRADKPIKTKSTQHPIQPHTDSAHMKIISDAIKEGWKA